ncbi:MAG: TnpV protein [Clostridia bacterium]|nr:TnpV protein [Clostridia bacterium]
MENKEMKESYINEKTGIEYILQGDYYIPNITIPKARRTGNIGKYGRLKLNYMKKYKIPEYTEMLLNNQLKSYLLDVEDECKQKLDNLIDEMAKKENITEELKMNNQIEWVQNMNSIKKMAEEIIINEMIYV